MRHADAGKLTGHRGDPLERLMKAQDTLRTALLILAKLEASIEARSMSVTEFSVRIEGARGVLKQSMLTLESLK